MPHKPRVYIVILIEKILNLYCYYSWIRANSVVINVLCVFDETSGADKLNTRTGVNSRQAQIHYNKMFYVNYLYKTSLKQLSGLRTNGHQGPVQRIHHAGAVQHTEQFVHQRLVGSLKVKPLGSLGNQRKCFILG